MSLIRPVEIRGFKSIYAAKIERGRVNGFIGASGVGESHWLKAWIWRGAAAIGLVPYNPALFLP